MYVVHVLQLQSTVEKQHTTIQLLRDDIRKEKVHVYQLYACIVHHMPDHSLANAQKLLYLHFMPLGGDIDSYSILV